MWFEITDFDSMRPFFMNIVSDSNHWMFISSNGGLTAGRKNNKYSLFPYYTDDKLTEFADYTGSKTIVRISKNGKERVWEPFSDRFADQYTISRNLYKSINGNKIRFEEINHDLGLIFRYQWSSSHKYGFVRRASFENLSDVPVEFVMLDGIQNIMPYGVSPDLQTTTSNLADAYKRSELVEVTGLGIYALSALIVDKAEPSEALKANVVWSAGLKNPQYLLSSLQLGSFRISGKVNPENDIKGEKGAYFLHSTLQLAAKSSHEWMIVANVNLNHAQVIALNELLNDTASLQSSVLEDVNLGTENLRKLVAGADGLRFSADPLMDARHFSNTLFNIMRGGTFDDNYSIDKKDLLGYLKNANKHVFERNKALFAQLSDVFHKKTLDTLCDSNNDADLCRLLREYLPLKFSRRHGDPSRPWNQFSINTHNELDGSKILDYEGNWRDLFQNWEALVHSYPEFIEGMIYKFLNASTFDGYNPYRVTKGGFDWEVIEPDNPWSYIGYWGDHQVIYLLKFLEFYQQYNPKALSSLFTAENFVYANVPYRIKSYTDIVTDPKNTITFDDEVEETVRERIHEMGADGALVTQPSGELHRVNFMEKILAMTLAKVSNFIPEGGIWMNTQRPEWNDANNALVGNGVSMVTLYYLRRFLSFLDTLVESGMPDSVSVSKELADCFNQILSVLEANKQVLGGSFDDEIRARITDGLGHAGSDYRTKVYENGFSGDTVLISKSTIQSFVSTTNSYLEHSIRRNRRSDNLFHAYNIMQRTPKGISISYLSEMLEGQVAVLSSGYLSADESVQVLKSLRNSALYRADQNSYMLYPNVQLPGFLQKNAIPKELVKYSELLTSLLEGSDTSIIQQDIKGGYHFNGGFRNAGDVSVALDNLTETKYAELVQKERSKVLDIFETVFNHKAFTGRSGTFYAYEGLGSIYWHMVSKLHLAAHECVVRAIQSSSKPETIAEMMALCDEIGEGIGVHKTPEVYGAFPTDPYSHTPYHRGAQQPGMTGQVKEDILVTIGEQGIRIENGVLSFDPGLLHEKDFSDSGRDVTFIDVSGRKSMVSLPNNSLAFTYCQVPVIYCFGDENRIQLHFMDGKTAIMDGLSMTRETSESVFMRSGQLSRIEVAFKRTSIRTT
jgi:hypothetical protein